MPDESSQRLEWNPENLQKILTDLYREAETDEALHRRLLAEPFEVLNSRIIIPESHRGGIFARERNKEILMLYVPAFGTPREAMPEGTTEVEPKPDFEPICTTWFPW